VSDKARLVTIIKKQWDLPGLVADLREAKWHQTEPARIDRLHWIGGYHIIEDLAKDAYPEKEWNEAAAEGFVHEIVDEYLEALGDALMDVTGKELRREHIYTTIEDNEVFIGQYEDIPADELREMGFEIEGISR
jgi:hypothetical protein